MELVQIAQKIDLVDACYHPSDASDLISSLLEDKINFLKIMNLKEFIGNESCDTRDTNKRIAELQAENDKAQEFFRTLRMDGRGVKLKCTIDITYAD